MPRDSSNLLERNLLLTVALLFLMVSVAYGCVIFSHYAYADDFMTLYAVHSPTLREKILPFYVTQGRPLAGLITRLVFRAAWTLDGLDKVRGASFGLALCWGAMLVAAFRRVAPWWVGLGAVSMLLLNPAVAVFVAWPSSGSQSLPAAVLGWLGGVGWRRALEREAGDTRRFWLHIAAGSGLALTALLIYQPCACFFLLPASIRLLDRDDPRGALHAGAWTAGGFTVICAGYFTIFQLLRPHLDKAEDIVMYRADVVRDVTGRLWFYGTDVLPRAFESWTVFFGAVPMGLALGTAGLLTLLFLVRLARTPGGTVVRLQALLVGPVFLGLASSPLLVVKDDYAPFRTLAVLYALVVVGLAGGVMEIRRGVAVGRRAARAAIAVAWAGLIAANVLTAAWVTGDGFVRRSVRELDLYRSFIRLRLADHPREVIVLLPARQDVPRLGNIRPEHEFGTASSHDQFNFPGLVYFAFEDGSQQDHPGRGIPPDAEVLVHKVPTDGPELFPADLPVIDATVVLQGGERSGEIPRSGPVTQDVFFGEVQSLTPNLRLSRWFGAYAVLSPTSILHRELGALELSGPGGHDCWFHREGLGWFWTGPQSFPFVYSAGRQHWLWYVRGTGRPAEFYDFDAPGKPRLLLE